MLTFLNSLIFSALAAALIPILIHLFNKQKTLKQPFSSLRFLKLLEKQRLKRIKLYQYLLILLRTLLIIFLVLAFTRPTITNPLFGSGESARSTAVIVLDDGMNMRRYDNSGMRFNRAKQRLKEILSTFNPQDRVFLISGSTGKHLRLDSLNLNNLAPGYRFTDWEAAKSSIRADLDNEKDFNREIYLISDFYGFPENALFTDGLPENSRLYLVGVNESDGLNAGIDTVHIENQLVEVNRAVQLSVRVYNSSATEAKNTLVSLFVNAKRMAQKNVNIEPGQKKSIQLSFVPKSFGLQQASIELDDDDLLADNHFNFVLRVPEKSRVLFIDDSPTVFLSTALDVIATAPSLNLTRESYSSWARRNLDSFDAVCISNPRLFTQPEIQRLKSFVQSGGGILLLPGQRQTPTQLNKMFSSLQSRVRITGLSQPKSAGSYFSLKKPDPGAPLFTGIFRSKATDVLLPKFFKAYAFQPSPVVSSELKFTNGQPFLIHQSLGKGELFVMNTFLDDDWTDLPYKGMFLPLFLRVLQRTASSGNSLLQGLTVGVPATQNFTGRTQNEDFFIVPPSQEPLRVFPRLIDGRLQFYWPGFDRPGLYPVYKDKQLIASLPVNIPSGYSGMHRSSFLSKVDNAQNTVYFEEHDDLAHQLVQARTGQELWRFFVVLALLVLIVELIVLKRLEGKKE